jgi:hypothetical protein
VITLMKANGGLVGSGMACVPITTSSSTQQRVGWFRELKP